MGAGRSKIFRANSGLLDFAVPIFWFSILETAVGMNREPRKPREKKESKWNFPGPKLVTLTGEWQPCPKPLPVRVFRGVNCGIQVQ
jgi:hypothetical protein